MCGIAGYFGKNKISDEQIKNCLSLMKRRGPNHSAFKHFETKDKNIYFLHSRLSIIDLEPRSHQPFQIGSQWIIFNGEVYNYLELKKNLQNLGYNFKTESDTEVFLAHFRHYGLKGLNQCDGMWAFAIFDEQSQEIILSRDRFGEKPLYYFEDTSGFYFASEPKFIFELLGHKLDINMAHIYRYMILGYKSLYKTKNTFFQKLYEIPKSTSLTVNNNQKKEYTYWHPQYNPQNNLSYDESIEKIRESLLQAVKIRLRADVPIAFCMSGGVDSNTLISIAKNVFNYNVHGFTIKNTDERYEENDLIEYAVKELGIRHSFISPSHENFIPKLKTLIHYHDAPVITVTYYVHWLLMEAIQQHGYRISVSGTGADELFSGYFDHHLAYFYDLHRSKNEKLLTQSIQNWEKHIRPAIRNPYLSKASLFIENPHFRSHIYFKTDEFKSYFYSPPDIPDFVETNFTTQSLLRNRMMNEIFYEATPPILHEDDLNAMFFSIENRSPFLDRGLFETCYSIPTHHLIQRGYAKALLRDSMKDIVPTHILENHKKVGFNAPILSLLNTEDPEVKSALLDSSFIYEYIKKDKIEALITKKDLPNSESKFLFYFLNSKIFLEEFS